MCVGGGGGGEGDGRVEGESRGGACVRVFFLFFCLQVLQNVSTS